MVKIYIAVNFRKNNSIFAAAISAADQSDQKNSGISASTPRADTVETSGNNGKPRPAPLRRSAQAALRSYKRRSPAASLVTFDTPRQVFM